MHFVALLIAGIGVLLLVYLSSVSTASRPRLNRAEPALVVVSLVAIFWALQTSVSDSAQPPMGSPSKSILHDLYFEKHCANHLGGSVSYKNGFAYCYRESLIVDTFVTSE